jgi:cysteinyl-tRNA synthetase
MSPLELCDTRTRATQTFVPADPLGQLGLFVCGPTVCDLPHLGHATTYTQFDFLVRLLRARGFAVTYVQNITDVDDKIIRRGARAGNRRARARAHAARRATGRDRSSLGRFDENQLAAAEPLRDRACPVDLGVRVGARVVDALDVYAGHLHHAASS